MVLKSETSSSSPHSPVHRFPPVLHLNWANLFVWLVQVLLVLNALQTAGVTHWKLIENDIMPEPSSLDPPKKTQSETGSKRDTLYPINQFSSSDPELAMLIRYSSRSSSGSGSPNRGATGFGSFRRQGSGHVNSCYSDGEGRDGEGTSMCPGGVTVSGEQRNTEGGGSKQPRKPDGSGTM